MKKFFKVLVFVISFVVSVNCAFAISTQKIEKLIKNSGMDDSAVIAVSIRNANSGNVVYEYNPKKLLHPASTLKVLSTYASVNTLGYDYSFKTGFYKDKDDNLYIKLGADPMLTSVQLKQAFQKVKSEAGSSYKNLYIDDSIIDKKEFADGWIWDDEISPYTPKVSSYNLDGNVVKINMTQNPQGLMDIELKPDYPMSVVSRIKAGAEKSVLDISRYPWANPDVVEILGYVAEPVSLFIPVSSPRRYFVYNIEKILDDCNIKVENNAFTSQILPSDAVLITEIENPIETVLPVILQNSNNLMAESISKVAASQKYSATGTNILAYQLFTEFYKKLGLDTEDIILADGCGVSRKNLISAGWMSDALVKLAKRKDFEKFKSYMAQTGDGTLSKRMLDLRGDAWFKTGSLSRISAIAGYIKSKDGNTYAVVLIEQNFLKPQAEAKAFEDELINLIYSR